MDRDHGAAAARLRIAIFPYQRNFLVEKLTELQRSLTLTPAAPPTLEALSQRACELRKASCESSPASAGKELTAPFCLANRLAALRTERQRSLGLTPTHCVRCLKPCPNLRFGAQASCESSPSFSWDGTYRSVLSGESPCGSSDRKATFAGANSCGFAYA